jgi:hypothetical protein
MVPFIEVSAGSGLEVVVYEMFGYTVNSPSQENSIKWRIRAEGSLKSRNMTFYLKDNAQDGIEEQNPSTEGAKKSLRGYTHT